MELLAMTHERPPYAFTYVLTPVFAAVRNRARRRERGDATRAGLFGGISIGVALCLFGAFFWLTWQVLDYEELGEYLVRLGFSWLFLTFLSFVAFSAVVSALSTFFLSEDLRLLIAAPIPPRALFYSRFAKTAVQSSWMVVAFMLPVLLGVGVARCAGPGYYLAGVLALVPFVLIPVAIGAMVTLLLVNVFPARRARDILMLMGLLFAVTIVLLLRFLQPERLLHVEVLPEITDFFKAIQSPITPLLPSFWAGETVFAGLQGRADWAHGLALWTTALGFTVLARMAFERFYFAGWSKAQEARKARFTRLAWVEAALGRLPIPLAWRSLVVKDLKVFLRDTTQWSQLLLLVALSAVYLYNFRVLDLQRIPYMTAFVKSAYAFVNLGLAAFVLSAVAVRFVFPAVSAEGPAFWIVRKAPTPMSAFLWSKFWTGLVPVLLMAETLTILSNKFLGVATPLQWIDAIAIFFMTFALVGLAAGMGARYPRFHAENVTQVAGSYGGIAFMVLAVAFIVIEIALIGWPTSTYLWYQYQNLPVPGRSQVFILASLAAAALFAIATFWIGMKQGIRALEEMDGM
jgi:ABC-2 type transport system permease protein